MILSIKNYLKYFTFAFSFYNVFAIKPCDLREDPMKFQSWDKFITEQPANWPLSQEIVPTTVNLSLSINDLQVINVKNLDIEIDLGITEKWYDDRLKPDYRTQKLAVLGAIWQPKITFVNGNVCSNIQGNDQTQFWRSSINGSVIYTERFLVKPKCTKNLAKYPFDVQTCFLKIGSYRFTAEEVNLEWDSDVPVELRAKKELGEFRFRKFNTYREFDERSAGNFSVLVIEIHLKRYRNREVIQNVIPSIILVKIAYGILWIKLSAIRMRIFICQLSLFGILLLFVTSNYGILNDTYFKALDIWFFVCFILILLPLIESIVIMHLINSRENNDGCNEIELENEHRLTCAGKKWAVWIEKFLTILHPIGLFFCTTLFFTLFDDDDE